MKGFDFWHSGGARDVVQRRKRDADDEHRGLRGMMAAGGNLAMVQLSLGHDPGAVHDAAARGIAGGANPLPHLETIQGAFGRHDMGAAKAHVGGPAAEATASMGASAYASGDHVAFGAAPDLHTAAHEAAHVVQQRAGVSVPGGVGRAGDAYEGHADRCADAVVSGRSAEPILDEVVGAGGSVQALQRRSVEDEGPVEDVGPVPSKEVDEEIAREQAESGDCRDKPNAAPLAEIIAVQSEGRPVVEGMRALAPGQPEGVGADEDPLHRMARGSRCDPRVGAAAGRHAVGR